METTQKNENASFESVWLLIQENSKQLKETRAILNEQLRETRAILDEKFKETDRQFKETDRQFKETDRQIKEMIKERKELDKKTRGLETLFTSQWGALIESLVEGKLVELLNGRGIPVNQTTQRYEAMFNKKQYEFDIIAINGTDAVIVEVKTTLTVKYVKEFSEKMIIIKDILPIFRPFNIKGAMAYLKQNEQSEKFAQSKGLLTIKATGDSAFITNTDDFKPKEW